MKALRGSAAHEVVADALVIAGVGLVFVGLRAIWGNGAMCLGGGALLALIGAALAPRRRGGP